MWGITLVTLRILLHFYKAVQYLKHSEHRNIVSLTLAVVVVTKWDVSRLRKIVHCIYRSGEQLNWTFCGTCHDNLLGITLSFLIGYMIYFGHCILHFFFNITVHFLRNLIFLIKGKSGIIINHVIKIHTVMNCYAP